LTNSQIKQQQENLKHLAAQYTQQELDMVLLQNKDITYAGIQSRNHPIYAKCREDLKAALKEFQLACAFLSQCKRTKAINYKNSNSYWLKHKLERFIGTYIANGSIIAAATCLGIKYVADKSNPMNVWLAISKDLPVTDDMIQLAMNLRRKED
jgi:hypothetical protein